MSDADTTKALAYWVIVLLVAVTLLSAMMAFLQGRSELKLNELNARLDKIESSL